MLLGWHNILERNDAHHAPVDREQAVHETLGHVGGDVRRSQNVFVADGQNIRDRIDQQTDNLLVDLNHDDDVAGHRLGWRIGEVPARWFERAHGASRFQVIKWLPDYLRWYRYAFATSYLRRPAETVHRQPVT